MAQSITYQYNFNGVDVTVNHHPKYFQHQDHVEWRSVPCSVTETGYYSMWLPVDSNADDVEKLILETVGDKPVTVYVPPLEQQDLFSWQMYRSMIHYTQCKKRGLIWIRKPLEDWMLLD